jgi:DUF4097 and DUF4098 domain-containing protein YvlB
MPTFDTPEPISVAVELGVGDIRIVAEERADTVVEVRPSDPGKKGDVTAAQQTKVDYAEGRLTVRGPKGWRQFSFRGGGESIDVEIALPAGSQVRAECGAADLRCTGILGECRIKTGVGAVEIDRAGSLHCKIGAGDVTVQQAIGHTEVTTGSGAMRIGTVDGTAVLRNSNGETWIGTATGDLRVRAANGRIQVDRAQATVAAKTANGAVCFGEVGPGAVVAKTGNGQVEIGIRHGVAAWLDLDTRFGKVRNDLGPVERPEPGEATVEVRAASAFGDIAIRRSFAGTRAEDKA